MYKKSELSNIRPGQAQRAFDLYKEVNSAKFAEIKKIHSYVN